VLETVATDVPEEIVHVTAPVTTLPAASFNCAVAVVVRPTWSVDDSRLTVTLATGDVVELWTVTVAVPALPPLTALIIAVPRLSAVTTPEVDTVATAVFELE
jgi:hypothetical protein